MKKYILLLTVFVSCMAAESHAQMDNEKLNSILYTLSDEIEGTNGGWQFVIDSVFFMCITDETHNRMRIISPVNEVKNVSDEQIKRCMEANYHTALDIKYAISDGLLWVVFIHPLKELSKEQVFSAISQVYSGVITFGTSYSGGALSFPSSEEGDSEEKEELDQN